MAESSLILCIFILTNFTVEESTLLSFPALVAGGVGIGALAAFLWSRYSTFRLSN